MNFTWRDYHPETMKYIENWLDESAVKSTGLDDGFHDFYEYWANEDGFVVGENFWCKVVFKMMSHWLLLPSVYTRIK